MKDLIAALRGEKSKNCTCCAYGSCECGCGVVWPDQVASEAADAIERLTAERNAFQDQCIALKQERHELVGQRDELLADAKRYRWLREQNALLENMTFYIGIDDQSEENGTLWVGVDLDAAVDAAIAKAEGK